MQRDEVETLKLIEENQARGHVTVAELSEPPSVMTKGSCVNVPPSLFSLHPHLTLFQLFPIC